MGTGRRETCLAPVQGSSGPAAREAGAQRLARPLERRRGSQARVSSEDRGNSAFWAAQGHKSQRAAA